MTDSASKANQEELPQVFLSYSGQDEMVDRLYRELSSAHQSGEIEIYFDKFVTPKDDNWPAEFERELDNTSVAVLCISRDYLQSDWVSTDSFGLDARAKKDTLALFPILLRACFWQDVDWLANLQIFPSDGMSIEEHSPQEQEQLIQEAANLIVEMAKEKAKSRSKPETEDRNQNVKISEALSDYPMSNQAKVICDHARKMASISGDSVVSIEDLFFAVLETGRASTLVSTTQFLWNVVVGRDEGNAYVEYLHKTFPNAAYSSTNSVVDYESVNDRAEYVSRPALSILKRAAKVSVATLAEQWKSSIDGDPPIHSRHIVAALLTPADEERAEADILFSQFGIDETQLRKDYYDFIAKECPNDNLSAWLNVLELDNKESEPASKEEKEPDVLEARLAGFSGDNWDKDDLLDITRDVEAFASLIAAASVQPPLSIGLFGDWGSGKSHFMKMVKARVQELANDTRKYRLKNEHLTRPLGYHENIVQIEFNAWHYIEGNLWASLVEHIFDNLRFSDHEKKDLVEERRTVLMEQLEIKKQIQAKVDERKGQLEVKKREAENRAAD